MQSQAQFQANEMGFLLYSTQLHLVLLPCDQKQETRCPLSTVQRLETLPPGVATILLWDCVVSGVTWNVEDAHEYMSASPVCAQSKVSIGPLPGPRSP